jgi:ankyrin repeat protein
MPTRFRWVFCQLETLRYCLPQNVRRTLNELPESLDETYERVVMEIKKANQVHAYRMLQCLAAAIRPLTVAELAELLTFDFNVAKGGIPKLNADWRWGDHEEAVLSTCSSLITVIPGRGSPVVQFSHFSVKEFLMSDRLAASTRDISQYHIALEGAHTALAQASLGVLLRDPDVTNSADGGPLARYAAEHWVTHAQVKNVALRVRDGMKRLFDPSKPYFSGWVQLYDADRYTFGQGTPSLEPGARQAYYAALCGFLEVVDHLARTYPECASTSGGRCGTALHAASFAGHLRIMPSLLRHGVSVNVQNYAGDGPLRFASQSGHCDVVRFLIDRGADVNLKGEGQNTPLNWAAHGGHVDVVQFLLAQNANVQTVDHHGRTPLHDAIWGDDPKGDYPRVVRLLLDNGADVNARDIQHRTPLHLVPMRPTKIDVLRILLEHGAEVDAEDKKGRNPLQELMHGQDGIARLLREFRSLRAQPNLASGVR